jgi:isopentenyl diphosphate isomerase/L-lactate dehydrogenase-like FMN-dependent dehydrogenase
VKKALSILRAEFARTIQLSGCADVRAIDEGLVRRAS